VDCFSKNYDDKKAQEKQILSRFYAKISESALFDYNGRNNNYPNQNFLSNSTCNMHGEFPCSGFDMWELKSKLVINITENCRFFLCILDKKNTTNIQQK